MGIDGVAARGVLDSHLAGGEDHSGTLWPALMLQAWRGDHAARAGAGLLRAE